MDIQQFNEAIIPYCKALGLVAATATTVVTQTMTPTPSPLHSPVQTQPSSGTSGNGLITSIVDDEDLPVSINGDLLSGQWKFMPGVTPDGNALRISPTGFTLVEQDGSLSSANPPINLAGTYLKSVSGDFEIATEITLGDADSAVVTLYGEIPLIADEFRVEKKSVETRIEDGRITVVVWNENDSTEKTFSMTPSEKINLTIGKKGKDIVFHVNGKQLGVVDASNVFLNGNVWFGFDAEGDSWLLTKLQVISKGGLFTPSDSSIFQVQTHSPLGLQKLAAQKRPEFLVGAAMPLGSLTSDNEFATIGLDNAIFGSITPENEMKMVNLQPQKGVYFFEKADGLVSLAKQNGLKVHGHALVFGEANPMWVNTLPVRTSVDKTQIENVMLDHITKVVSHFGSDVSEWDVINEPIADYDEFDSRGRILRRHIWYRAMGEQYMIKAITAAHNANPDAILYINEYGLEADDERWDAFFATMQKLKTQLQQNNVPLEKVGVGFQSHVYEEGDKINPTVLRNNIRQLGTLGFKVRISENDVYSGDGDSVQGQQYADIFNACFSEKNCTAWTGWILSDRYNVWMDDEGEVQFGVDGLFDEDMKPRPGYTSIQKVLQK
jgi:endo-1,4-beta-xylanase